MFTAALFTIARIWKQPKCPSADEDVVRIYSGYDSAIKPNEIVPFAAALVDLEGIMLSEINQRKTDSEWYHLHWNLKVTTD